MFKDGHSLGGGELSMDFCTYGHFFAIFKSWLFLIVLGMYDGQTRPFGLPNCIRSTWLSVGEIS